MNAPETQAWLDAMGGPTAAVATQLETAVRDFSVAVGALDRQVSELLQLLQASDMEEPDAELRAMYKAGYQKLEGQRRQLGEMSALIRAIRETQREIGDYNTRVRERAAALGYTV